jgi:hypothetical protein
MRFPSLGLPIFSFLLFVPTAQSPPWTIDILICLIYALTGSQRLPLHWELVIPVSGGNQRARSLAATRPLRMQGRVQATIEWRGLTSTFQHQPRWPEESLQISHRPPMRPQGPDLKDQPPRKGCRRRRLSSVDMRMCWDRRRHASHDIFTCG